jgi:hypothetical protein
MSEIPDLARVEVAIVERTNAFRTGQGLSMLSRNGALDRAARDFATYLAKSGKFAHEADGRQPADRTKAAGYWHCIVAENLALNLDSRGFTVQKLAGEAIEGWKKSPGHRKNMELPYVTEIGVGVAQAMDAAPKFISVQLFGRPQTLGYEFRVNNSSLHAVTYKFAGKSFEVEPRVIATHKVCQPGKLHFERAGNWLSGKRIDAHYEVTGETAFTLKDGPGASVRIEVRK